MAEDNGPSFMGWTELCNNYCCYSLPPGSHVQSGLGIAGNLEAVIHIEPEAKPSFFKPQTVSYAIKPKVE